MKKFLLKEFYRFIVISLCVFFKDRGETEF